MLNVYPVYRPGLSRRLTRLENKLDLPSDERHISYASLLTSSTRELAAPRVKENLGAPKFRPQNDSDRTRDASLGLGDEGLERSLSIQQTGKSVWVGKDSEVTVEGWVLEWWEAQGYKGWVVESVKGLLLILSQVPLGRIHNYYSLRSAHVAGSVSLSAWCVRDALSNSPSRSWRRHIRACPSRALRDAPTENEQD